MSNKKENQHEDNFENVESALSKTEHYIEENQKKLSLIALAIIVIVAGYWGVKKLYVQPQEQTAQEQLFFAQHYFEKDSFKLALDGANNHPGFIEIIDEYGSTKAGKLAHYYAGISNLHLGNYQVAINFLDSFSSDEEFVAATAEGAKGDAYLELGNIDKAIKQYTKAADYNNELTAPTYLVKLGLVYEGKGSFDKAVEAYTKVKTLYASSVEARQIDKYITRAKMN